MTVSPSFLLFRLLHPWRALITCFSKCPQILMFVWCFLIIRLGLFVQLLSRVWLFATPWTAAHQTSLSITTTGACSNSCPTCQFCHLRNSSPVVPSSSNLQSYRASGSFPMSQFFTSGGQSLEFQLQHQSFQCIFSGQFPLGLTSLISLQSTGLSRVFSSTIVQKYQFFGAQPALWSNSHFHTWLLEKP